MKVCCLIRNQAILRPIQKWSKKTNDPERQGQKLAGKPKMDLNSLPKNHK
jgi:hypothetical protein